MKGQKSTYCEYCGDFHDPQREYQSSVRVGELIPDYEFEAYQDGEVKTVKLSDYRGSWLVLMFYPTDWGAVCATELNDLARLYPEFTKLGAEVVSVSTDSPYAHKAWRESSDAIKEVNFPMGADPSGKMALAFGVLVEGGDMPFLEGEGTSLRGTFLVDPKGMLRTMEVSETEIGRAGAETLRKLKAAQFVDKAPGNVSSANRDGK